MSRALRFLASGYLLACFLLVLPLQAQVPQIINYQGRINVGAVNFNGTGQFAFALVNTNGTTTYWSNDGTSTAGSQPTNAVSIQVTNGLYSIFLGDATVTNMTAIPYSVFANSDVRLRIWFNDGNHGFQLLSPDQRIASVGYAMSANSVNGITLTGSGTLNVGTGGSLGTAAFSSSTDYVQTSTLGSGVQSALSNAVDSPTGLASSASQPTMKIGPSSHNFVFLGDSLTVGPYAANPQNSIAAVCQSTGLGAGGAVMYDLGFSGETTPLIFGQYYGAPTVNTTITAPSIASNNVTLGSASGIAVGMTLTSTILAADTTIIGLNGTTATLSALPLSRGTSINCSATSPPVTTTVTENIVGSNTVTLGSATGVAVGMAISASIIPPNTTITALSGTSATLSNTPTGEGYNVACSIANPPVGIIYGGLYPGRAANNWTNFSGTVHQLSPAVTGTAADLNLWTGTNDYPDNITAETTVTCTSTAGSPNLMVTGGSYNGFVYGLVLTGSNLSASSPPYIVSGYGTANLVMSGNATATGSFTATVHYPTTPLVTFESYFSGLIAQAHEDGYEVNVSTLHACGNNPGQGSPVSNVFRGIWNNYILANTAGADHVIDITKVLPDYGSVVGSPLLSSADWLHMSTQGDAMLGQYWTQQIFYNEFPNSAAWNPYAPGQLPAAWIPSSVPTLAANNTFTQTQYLDAPVTGGTGTGQIIAAGNVLTVSAGTAGAAPAVLNLSGNSGAPLINFQEGSTTEGSIFHDGNLNLVNDNPSGSIKLMNTAAVNVPQFSVNADGSFTLRSNAAPNILNMVGVGSGVDEIVFDGWTTYTDSGDYRLTDTINGNIQLQITGNKNAASSLFEIPNGAFQIDAGDSIISAGNSIIDGVGKGLQVKEGTNAKQGTVTLSGGTATVNNTSVTANSRIFLTAQDNNTKGTLRISSRSPGVSFTITSSNTTDSGAVGWEIFEPAP